MRAHSRTLNASKPKCESQPGRGSLDDTQRQPSSCKARAKRSSLLEPTRSDQRPWVQERPRSPAPSARRQPRLLPDEEQGRPPHRRGRAIPIVYAQSTATDPTPASRRAPFAAGDRLRRRSHGRTGLQLIATLPRTRPGYGAARAIAPMPVIVRRSSIPPAPPRHRPGDVARSSERLEGTASPAAIGASRTALAPSPGSRSRDRGGSAPRTCRAQLARGGRRGSPHPRLIRTTHRRRRRWRGSPRARTVARGGCRFRAWCRPTSGLCDAAWSGRGALGDDSQLPAGERILQSMGGLRPGPEACWPQRCAGQRGV